MSENNKHNILYFEGQSMKQLHSNMDEWQKDNEKRFLSMSVNKDGDNYCCIALTNPSEVVIVGQDGGYGEYIPVQVKKATGQLRVITLSK
tara:strand:+ start:268 stop:537 length:270 start_codon:yes stop_codon:yes gene_type:complete